MLIGLLPVRKLQNLVVWLSAVVLMICSSLLQAADVNNVRIWLAPDHARLVFDMSGPA